MFRPISKQSAESRLGSLEGCYLHYDGRKTKWIRSGKASGAGKNACFNGRLDTHTKNARMVDQMRKHRFYQEYPEKGVKNIGEIEGCFEHLKVYCGMVFDRMEDVSPLCLECAENSLFVWSKGCIDIMKQRDCSIQESQLLAISYLWEICDDLLLAKKDNVSFSPGFELLGLRVN